MADAGSRDGCFLCTAAEDGVAGRLVVSCDAETVTLLNRFQYNTGHLMVAPRSHIADLLAAGDDAAAAMMVAARRAMKALAVAMQPDGYNVGVNHGGSAGASVAHLHLHVVPRWGGDTNFMPVVAETKVLPEMLDETAAKLRTAYAALTG